METRWALAIAGAAGVALYFVHNKTATPTAPAVPQSLSKQEQISRTAGAIGGAIGTKVANAIPVLRPFAKTVGASAAMDTTVNVRETINAGKGFVSIAHGNVWGGGKQIVESGFKTAISPVQSAYKIVKGWF